ncbi:hypothetical protein SAMN05444285_1746 [Draconibacterium orientale]|uniref:Lipoprotein n=1 Tax=Draconibacterium orientale TaxID=1168034 RepID=A0A1I0K2G8_9BACT|nr:hypothetical protein SAMN05444285_1746 [Draconibacterium orientale]
MKRLQFIICFLIAVLLFGCEEEKLDIEKHCCPGNRI